MYYKDDIYYFVMIVKKTSLLDKGVFREDRSETVLLLFFDNIDRNVLLEYVKEAVNFLTNFVFSNLEYVINYYG